MNRWDSLAQNHVAGRIGTHSPFGYAEPMMGTIDPGDKAWEVNDEVAASAEDENQVGKTTAEETEA